MIPDADTWTTMTRTAPSCAVPLAAFDTVHVTAGPGAWRLRVEQSPDPRDPHLASHFPTFTIYPGVFLLETVSQAVGQALDQGDGRHLRVAAIHAMRFISPLLSPATLAADLHVVQEPDDPDAYDVRASCRRREGGPVVADMHVTLRRHDHAA